MDGAAERRAGGTADDRTRRRDQPGLLSRRFDGGVLGALRRQRRRVRGAVRGRCAQEADVAPGSRCGARLDTGRQARALRLGPVGGAGRLSAAVHDRPRRRRRAAAAAAHRLRRRILARRRAHRLRAAAARVHDVEAIPRRPDDADLARRSGDLADRAGAAGQLERLPAHVGRRQGLVSLGPRRSGDALQLRPRHEEGGARGREPRDGLQVGIRRTATPS